MWFAHLVSSDLTCVTFVPAYCVQRKRRSKEVLYIPIYIPEYTCIPSERGSERDRLTDRVVVAVDIDVDVMHVV